MRIREEREEREARPTSNAVGEQVIWYDAARIPLVHISDGVQAAELL